MGRSLGSPLDGHAALKDLGRIVSEMSNMKATMREMARSARLRQQEDIIARNQRAREQVKHEFVMRNVAKQIDEQREYLASQASKRHERRQATWRKEQLKEARARRDGGTARLAAKRPNTPKWQKLEPRPACSWFSFLLFPNSSL